MDICGGAAAIFQDVLSTWAKNDVCCSGKYIDIVEETWKSMSFDCLHIQRESQAQLSQRSRSSIEWI